MTHQIVIDPPKPGSETWRKTMSSSKIATVLGLSRFQSPFSLWHEMNGTIDPELFDESMGAWGHISEASLAEWWIYNNPGWLLNRADARGSELAYTNHAVPFPNITTIDRRAFNRRSKKGEEFHVIECKTARDLHDWGRPGQENAVPADYYAQTLWHMGISGIHRSSIVVLGPFGEPEIHEVPWDQEVFDGMVDEAGRWMKSLEDGVPPPLDSSERTYEVVRGLHPDIDLKAVVDVPLDVAREIHEDVLALDELESRVQLHKTLLIERMGTAKLATVAVPGVEKPVKLADRRAKGQGKPYVQINKKANLQDAA